MPMGYPPNSIAPNLLRFLWCAIIVFGTGNLSLLYPYPGRGLIRPGCKTDSSVRAGGFSFNGNLCVLRDYLAIFGMRSRGLYSLRLLSRA